MVGLDGGSPGSILESGVRGAGEVLGRQVVVGRLSRAGRDAQRVLVLVVGGRSV